ncbi:MAG TPA: glycosyltransferase, partial [Casimicrobiaceae bacterium]|nr:glycosyltransferase [Casimicrobiaceae bacterium]
MSVDTAQIIRRALRLQRSGDLDAAEALYRQALEAHPDHPDCLHMLGVVCLRRKRYLQGIELIERACIVSQWRNPYQFSNLVRGLEHLVATLPPPADALERGNAVTAERTTRAAARSRDATPLVTIVVPSYNHSQFVRAALQSVFAQTYRPLELIVIDDGSTDGSAPIIRDALSDRSIPSTFLSRENRGAPATLNECIALATGRYVNPLNSDDLFMPNRIEEMVRAVHRSGAEWGFSCCALIGDDGGPIAEGEARAAAVRAHFLSPGAAEPTSHRFVLSNPAISTGNIFASTELVQKIGGFSSRYRYNHDWDFCLNASWYSEPVFVRTELYRYRLHEMNTISEPGSAARYEADDVVSRYCRKAERETP